MDLLHKSMRFLRRRIRAIKNGRVNGYSQESYHLQRFLEFKKRYKRILGYNLNRANGQTKRALIIGSGFPDVELELCLIKALETVGYTSSALIAHERGNQNYYRLAGVKNIYFCDDFNATPDLNKAKEILEKYPSTKELLKFEYLDVRVGQIAISTALRKLRIGTLDLNLEEHKKELRDCLAASITSAQTAQKLVQKTNPDLAVFVDWVYTPEAEMFDYCLAKNIDSISWDFAHKGNALILRRYTYEDRGVENNSLSDETWRYLRDIKWESSYSEELQREFYNTYASGDWYSVVGTQFNTKIKEAKAIRKQLGLDPEKKTAIIFPHIFWDASLMWGEDLFRDYEEWFVETVRAACDNKNVNWVIKIHPANVSKSKLEGFEGESSEVLAIHKHIGELPKHITLIDEDTDINTYSLFKLMDFCITVRGTVGMEAACLGVPALTAGTGRYDRKGFTIDSDSQQEYLQKIREIPEIEPLSPDQIELAQRFAYGLFILRPFRFTEISVEFPESENLLARYSIKIESKNDWYNAPDIKAFTEWVGSKNKDFLMPLTPTEQDKLQKNDLTEIVD